MYSTAISWLLFLVLFFSVHFISFNSKKTIFKSTDSFWPHLFLHNKFIPATAFVLLCWFVGFFTFFKNCINVNKQLAADLKVESEDDEGSSFLNDKNQYL